MSSAYKLTFTFCRAVADPPTLKMLLFMKLLGGYSTSMLLQVSVNQSNTSESLCKKTWYHSLILDFAYWLYSISNMDGWRPDSCVVVPVRHLWIWVEVYRLRCMRCWCTVILCMSLCGYKDQTAMWTSTLTLTTFMSLGLKRTRRCREDECVFSHFHVGLFGARSEHIWTGGWLRLSNIQIKS